MADKFNAKDALADYVTVPQRIAQFYELFGGGRLVTGDVRLTSEPDGKPRVMVQAFAYRTVDDPQPGVGWSWMELPGTTSFTRGSELENTETSAWGRAIASLGILVDRSVASVNEIKAKTPDGPQSQPAALSAPVAPPKVQKRDEVITAGPPPAQYPSGHIETLTGIVTREGTIKAGGAAGYKCESRQTPDGLHAFGFRLEIDRDKAIPQALVEGQLAEDIIDTLAGNTESLINTWAEVTGRMFHVTEPGKTSFYRLRVTAMKTKAWTLPSEAPSAAMGL
ncbi:hypothetical protein UFOVP960_17 [uncultured Caudovirales phage]|uniref:Uncharacterized protein n=1 Tax=uncultured Caudovirales phage TaxID=2100421 RepID=A0A6J5PPY3_9CAUD|nr:hypothetical protein UFOVP960_17 [uncultured Caudovirales phage]